MCRPQDTISRRAFAACRAYTRCFQGDSRPQPYLTGGTSAPQRSRMYPARRLAQARSISRQLFRLRLCAGRDTDFAMATGHRQAHNAHPQGC
ncbi:protein of unknown function [Ralstonia solanacearum CMR15]|nr:protein of unknown function [Ralstonia solanacearum CMR15]